ALPIWRSTSAVGAEARSPGVGQRRIHSVQRGSTRTTGVRWSITSETRIAQGGTSWRQGRSRPFPANQLITESMASSLSVASETVEKDWDTRGRYPIIMGEREPYGCGDGGRAPQTSADDGDLHPPFMRRVRQLTRARGVDGHEHHRLAGRGSRQTGPGP